MRICVYITARTVIRAPVVEAQKRKKIIIWPMRNKQCYTTRVCVSGSECLEFSCDFYPWALIIEFKNWLCLVSDPEQTAPLSSNRRRLRKQITLRQQTQSLRSKAEDLNCSFLNWTENFCHWFVYSVKTLSLLQTITLLQVYTHTHSHWLFPYICVTFVSTMTMYIKLYKRYSQYEQGQQEPCSCSVWQWSCFKRCSLVWESRRYLQTLIFKGNAQALICVKTVCLVLGRPPFVNQIHFFFILSFFHM